MYLNLDELKQYSDLYAESATISETTANYLVSEFAQVGMQTTQGFADGMDADAPAAKIQEVGKAVVDALKDTLGVHSPSEVMEEVGQFLNAGMSLGISETAEGPESPITQMMLVANAIIKSAKERLSRQKWHSFGENVVLGLADGINDKKSVAVDAAKDLARAVEAAAKEEAGINSPSKVFMDMGRNMDAGLALGLLQYASMVTSASQWIASDTVKHANGAISAIYGNYNSLFSGRPTITPGVDLSEVVAGARAANAMFGQARAYQMGYASGGGSYSNVSNGYNVTINAPTGNGRDIARAFEEYIVRR